MAYLNGKRVFSVVKPVVSHHESDPTVPEWAKQPNKPQYNAEEVGAIPAADYENISSRITRNAKEIANIKAGMPDEDFLVDSTAAEVKDVPEDALPYAEVVEIGGMTRKCTNLINFRDWTEAGTLNSDGSLTITTINSAFNISRTLTGLLLSGTYTLTNQSGTLVYVQASSDDYSKAVKVGTSKTFTYDGTSYLRIVCANQAANTTVTYRLMLNADHTALPYEPFFEGLRSAPVIEVESVGVNLFGGEALADAIAASAYNPQYVTIDNIAGTITYYAGIGSYAVFKDVKPDTQYTLIIKGINTTGATEANFAVYYKDGSYQALNFGSTTEVSTNVFITPKDKSVAGFGPINSQGTTKLYYNDCGIFEGVLTADDFIPYTRHTLPIPEAVRNIHGYDWGINESVYNYVDLDKEQFVKRVEKDVFDGSNDEVYYPAMTGAEFTLFTIALSGAYSYSPAITNYNIPYAISWDVTSAHYYVTMDSVVLVLPNSQATSIETLRTYLAENPMTVFYELAEPVITDISDILPADNLIGVEAGGTVRMVNEYGYDVPSTIVYQLDNESEVSA